VAELADAADLKSAAVRAASRFDPGRPYLRYSLGESGFGAPGVPSPAVCSTGAARAAANAFVTTSPRTPSARCVYFEVILGSSARGAPAQPPSPRPPRPRCRTNAEGRGSGPARDRAAVERIPAAARAGVRDRGRRRPASLLAPPAPLLPELVQLAEGDGAVLQRARREPRALAVGEVLEFGEERCASRLRAAGESSAPSALRFLIVFCLVRPEPSSTG
jgi:hypothetical protein